MLIVLGMAALVPSWCVSSMDHGSISLVVSHTGRLASDAMARKERHENYLHLMRRGANSAIVSHQSYSKDEQAAIRARLKVGTTNWTAEAAVGAQGSGVLDMTSRGFGGANSSSVGSTAGYWKDANTYFRHNVSECQELCLRNSLCIGFVDKPNISATNSTPEYPRSCFFRSEMEYAGWVGDNYTWYGLTVAWTRHNNTNVDGSETYDVFDWANTPDCTPDNTPECNFICRQTPSTNVSAMCNVWSADRSKFYYDSGDNRSSLLHCERYCRDAPACVGFVDVWENPPYCEMKTSVQTTAYAAGNVTGRQGRRHASRDFWQMT